MHCSDVRPRKGPAGDARRALSPLRWHSLPAKYAIVMSTPKTATTLDGPKLPGPTTMGRLTVSTVPAPLASVYGVDTATEQPGCSAQMTARRYQGRVKLKGDQHTPRTVTLTQLPPNENERHTGRVQNARQQSQW
jgi:hypothetical protein